MPTADQPPRAPYRHIQRNYPAMRGPSSKLLKTVPYQAVANSLYQAPDENLARFPKRCCRGNQCLAKLLHQETLDAPPSPSELSHRDAFLAAVSGTRKELYKDGQNRARDRLVNKLRLSFEPTHSACKATVGYDFYGSQPRDTPGHQSYWWFTPDGGSVQVCRDAWRMLHAVSESRLCALAKEVKKDPITFQRTVLPYSSKKSSDVRALLDDYFKPENGRCEKMPNPQSGREEWHLPSWLKKSVVYKLYSDECDELSGEICFCF